MRGRGIKTAHNKHYYLINIHLGYTTASTYEPTTIRHAQCNFLTPPTKLRCTHCEKYRKTLYTLLSKHSKPQTIQPTPVHQQQLSIQPSDAQPYPLYNLQTHNRYTTFRRTTIIYTTTTSTHTI